MRRFLIGALLACSFCVLLANPSLAQFVTYSFTGHVTNITDSQAILASYVSVGDTFTGTVSLNRSYPGDQFPNDTVGPVGIFLTFPHVNATWLEFYYSYFNGVDMVNGLHSIGGWTAPGFDVGSFLALTPGGEMDISGLEGSGIPGDFFVVEGVFDNIQGGIITPEGDSRLLFSAGLLLPALALLKARRRTRATK